MGRGLDDYRITIEFSRNEAMFALGAVSIFTPIIGPTQGDKQRKNLFIAAMPFILDSKAQVVISSQGTGSIITFKVDHIRQVHSISH